MELLAPGSQNAQNEPPEAHSGHIWHQAAKMLKVSLLRLILAISGARQPKCQNEPPEAHSGYIWRQAAKILKMSLLRLTLAISGARQPKCSK